MVAVTDKSALFTGSQCGYVNNVLAKLAKQQRGDHSTTRCTLRGQTLWTGMPRCVALAHNTDDMSIALLTLLDFFAIFLGSAWKSDAATAPSQMVSASSIYCSVNWQIVK